MPQPPTTGVLLVGHGSRNAAANAEFEALVQLCRARWPTRLVAHAYVELARPLLDDALTDMAARVQQVVAVPVFLFMAGHIKNDLPLALARARERVPATRFVAAAPLGVHPGMVTVAGTRLAAAAAPPRAHDAAATRHKTALMVVGRGASDPDANGDMCKMARLIAEGQGYGWVEVAFSGIAKPAVTLTLELLARARPERLVVLPYLLFEGRLIDTLRADLEAFAAAHPWVTTALAAHLGPDPGLVEVLEARLQQAVGGSAPLPCDTCQYRTPLGAVGKEVGGLRALLWSLRHTFTHGQAMPHGHAHAPLHKHVLVCGNVDCATGGSLALIASLRRRIKAAGRQRDIRVTRTSCMGRCGEGPTVAVYPDGIWYRAVAESDAPDLVDEHLLGDRLVARLVDNIMS